LLARRVPLALLTLLLSTALFGQTNTAAGAGIYPAQPQPNSFANLGVRPEVLPWDQGEAGLHLLAKKLKNTGRIMHLTAHPDDEDGALLTYLARGQGRQVLLMSLTRGEGGQNRTGSNLWDELGVLRTLELLESTRYYGTELRFSRVADFGFSKSADETFKKWGGHEVPLRDIVYVIREWKPDVLFTRFSGTPRDGHGHHQASAILAPEAVKCAADPNCFPDQLKTLTTWQVLKLYMGNQGGEYTVRYDVSQIDPDTKLSYAQMALEGFKHQASQLSGTFTPPSGPNWRSYKLVSTTIPNYKPDKEQDFFDGIDTTLPGIVKRFFPPEQQPSAVVHWKLVDGLIDAGINAWNPESFAKAKDRLTSFFSAAPTSLASSQVSAAKEAQLNDALQKSLSLTLRTATKSPLLAPGSSAAATVTVTNGGKNAIAPFAPQITGKVYLSGYERKDPSPLAAGSNHSYNATVHVGDNSPIRRQHWTRENPETDAVYKVDPTFATLPLPPDSLYARFPYEYNGLREEIFRPLTIGDQKGTAVSIGNPISILFSHPQQVQPTANPEFETGVAVEAVLETGELQVSLTAPSGWQVSPSSVRLDFDKPGEKKEARFTVRPINHVGKITQLKATATFKGKTYSEGFSTVTRADLDTFYYYQPAIQRVSIVDVNVPKNLRVGYIPGAGDDIFPVLQQLGLNAKQISNDELVKGDLHQYDTIVVGIRGYDERPEIRANNQRLLDFVKDGGTLLVQNQKAEDLFNSGKFTPYPATLGRQRVSVEEAPVEVLAPNDSVFNAPNKITQADFDGWVQERGINFMSDWDSKFEPLLASNDPGEQPLKGGLLRAKYGKGTYIYTGYAFFRQLPAGVPGAVRLYVNLLTAGHEGK
jgi:LmbE family N-acetylglucosaminyl deacetylase